jgi:hypothetical protein
VIYMQGVAIELAWHTQVSHHWCSRGPVEHNDHVRRHTDQADYANKSLLPISFLQDLSISFPTPASHPSYNSLLNQRSHNAPTSTTMSKSLARRIPDDVWNLHKATIRELYIVEDRKLDGYDGVMDIMTKRYDFSPTYVFTWTHRSQIKLTCT